MKTIQKILELLSRLLYLYFTIFNLKVPELLPGLQYFLYGFGGPYI